MIKHYLIVIAWTISDRNSGRNLSWIEPIVDYIADKGRHAQTVYGLDIYDWGPQNGQALKEGWRVMDGPLRTVTSYGLQYSVCEYATDISTRGDAEAAAWYDRTHSWITGSANPDGAWVPPYPPLDMCVFNVNAAYNWVGGPLTDREFAEWAPSSPAFNKA